MESDFITKGTPFSLFGKVRKMDKEILIALVGVIYILGEVIKFRALKKQNGNFTVNDRRMLNDLHTLHMPTDRVPPEHHIKAILLLLKKIDTHLEKWDCPYHKNK